MTTAKKLLTSADLFLMSFPEGVKAEIVEGEIVETQPARAEHSDVIGSFYFVLRDKFHNKGGRGGPGGWWLLSEAAVSYGPYNLFCHDLAGWRRHRVPEKPSGFPIEHTPDWVCEVLSSNKKLDLVTKKKILHEHKIPYYWIVDVESQILSVLKWFEPGYVAIADVTVDDVAKLEPFEAVEFKMKYFFGADLDDEG